MEIITATAILGLMLMFSLTILMMAVSYTFDDIQDGGADLGMVNQAFGTEIPSGWGLIPLWPKIWDVDDSNGATAAVTGTSGQWMRTTLQFAITSADDIAYVDFPLPPDYNESENDLYLCMLINVDDGTAAHHSDWDGTVRRVPTREPDSDGCELADAAGSGLTLVQQTTDDTAKEVYSVKLDLGGVLQFRRLDWVQVHVFCDQSAVDVTATPYVHMAYAIYKR